MLSIPSHPDTSPFYAVNHLLPSCQSFQCCQSPPNQLSVFSMLSITSYPAVSLFNAVNHLLTSCQFFQCWQSPPTQLSVFSMLTIPSYPSASPFHAVCHLLPSASPSYVVNHLLPNWKSLCTVNTFTSFQLQVPSMLSIPSYPAASPFHASCQSSLCGQQMSIPSMLSPAVNPFYAVTSCQSLAECNLFSGSQIVKVFYWNIFLEHSLPHN